MSYHLTSVRAKHFSPLRCYFQVISQLETSCLRDVYTAWSADNHPVTHLRFDYISRERQSRDYVMEDHEAAVVSSISNTRDSVSSGYPKHREESSKDDTQWSIFDEVRGVWIADETLSRLFVTSSESKQK